MDCINLVINIESKLKLVLIIFCNLKFKTMKKVFLVLALVAVYGVSMAMSGSGVVTVDNMQVTVVTGMDDSNVVAPEAEKEKEKATKKESKSAKSEGCAGEKSAAKADGCGGEKSAAKADGCGDKTKTAAAEKK